MIIICTLALGGSLTGGLIVICFCRVKYDEMASFRLNNGFSLPKNEHVTRLLNSRIFCVGARGL